MGANNGSLVFKEAQSRFRLRLFSQVIQFAIVAVLRPFRSSDRIANYSSGADVLYELGGHITYFEMFYGIK